MKKTKQLLLLSLLLSGDLFANTPSLENSNIYARSHTLSRATPVYEWGGNDRKGNIGDIYKYNNPYSNKIEFFKLKSLGSDQKYWYFPTDQRDNQYWEFIGPYEWGINDRKGNIGDIYVYNNPYNGDQELFKLTNLGQDGRYWYFPTDKSDNTYWNYFIASSAYDYSDSKDVNISVEMNIPKADEITAFVDKKVKLDKPDTVKLDNITIYQEDGEWYLDNRTFRPIASLSVKYSSAKTGDHIANLEFDNEIEAYTKAKILFNRDNINEISYLNLLPIFSPKIDLGEQKQDCTKVSGTCYNSPKIGAERDNYERTLAHIKESFNKVSFVSAIHNFFDNHCNLYSDCVDYNNNYPNALNYSIRNYLSMGLKGHNLSMRVMRNQYAAEGMGGGSAADINQAISTGGGWASIWEDYINPNKDVYRELPIKTLFHEIAHAYSFSHNSGMTYGFADYMSNNYIPSEGVDISKIPVITRPDILIESKVTSDREIELALYSSVGESEFSGPIKFNVISAQSLSFTTKFLENKLSIKFDELPDAPVYIQVWTESSKYLSTIKVEAYDLIKSQKYKVNGKDMIALNPLLINPKNNGWSIRSQCSMPGMHLATKQDYQELYSKLEKEGELDQLPFKNFLSSDEPSGYVIWEVDFNQNPMGANWYSMHNIIGTDKGLVCVTK
ncbi:hypothetical protein ACPV3S_20350 [Photobacterium damselae]|uniref:hypothetical protein n=1 Tax=Photobacterium damselae TaxID=38293 RepID=UPI004068971B